MTPKEFLEYYITNDEEAPEDSVCVDDGEWVDYGKYSYKNTVYKLGDQYLEIRQSRSGSYHTDYYYLDPDCYEVIPKEVKVITYVAK